MEEDVLDIDRLRTVFDVCDDKKEGFITTERFKDLATEHFGADEKVVGIIQILDPEGKGKINFEDFCKGVQQIQELQTPLSPIASNTHNVFNPFLHNGTATNRFDEDIIGVESSPTEASKASTYNEYDLATDENTDEDGHGLLIDFSTPEPVRRSLPLQNGRLDFTDEENFESYGENEDLESDTSDQIHQKINYESGHRPRSRRSDKHYRRSTGPRIISSSAHASHLQSKSRTEPADEIFDDIDDSLQNYNDRIRSLEGQVSKLSEEKSSHDVSHGRLKDENSLLMKSIVERIHTLEEQVKDVEVKSEEKLNVEHKKFTEMLSRAEREKTEQFYIAQRLQNIEKEYEELKRENPKLKIEIDRLRAVKLEIQDKLSEVQSDYNTLLAEHEDTKLKFEKERETTGQLLDELGKELGELRQYKIETDLHKPRSSSMADLPNRYQALNTEVNRLKEALAVEWRTLSQETDQTKRENRQLQDLNEDLNAQLLTRCINEGKSLVRDSTEQSLASELDHLTKEELMSRLQEQEKVNFNLKQYVDKIILTILEKNPSILEITNR